jgi:hypothetical protein
VKVVDSDGSNDAMFDPATQHGAISPRLIRGCSGATAVYAFPEIALSVRQNQRLVKAQERKRSDRAYSLSIGAGKNLNQSKGFPGMTMPGAAFSIDD